MQDAAPSTTLSVCIRRPCEDVYAFVADPERLPQWAAAFCRSIHSEGEDWVADTPNGTVRVRFTGPNPYGILDHTVTLPSGDAVHVPMRVIPNGAGSEVLFTLFQPPGMTEAQFEADLAMVRRDLQTLKALLEK